MCGILGVLRFDGEAVSNNLLRTMADSIPHRGPDDYGEYSSGPIGLANLRLSVIDLATGHQPIFNETGDLVIVFNGEIYNYRELRSQLPGHCFRTSSDTESILHLYEEHGPDSIRLLNGMFSIAIWDQRKKELFLSRDRLGIKPLYLYKDEKALVFGSEIKALFASGLVPRRINRSSVNPYLQLKYVPGTETLFAGVTRLRPGGWLKIDRTGRVHSGEYWRYQLAEEKGHPEQQLIDELTHLVEVSVQDQMISDVPIGAYLSGGIDSGIVVTEMAKLTEGPVTAFTVEYEDSLQKNNESSYARLTAHQARCDHTVVHCTDRIATRILPLLVHHLDEPISEPLLAPSFLLAKAARERVTVVLTGEGADEFLAGYSRYKIAFIEKLLHAIPRVLRERAFALSQKYFGVQDLKSRILRASLDPRSILDWHLLFRQEELALLSKVEDSPCGAFASDPAMSSSRGLIDVLLTIDSRFRLPDYILTRADKMTMASSLEMRPPFLDNRLIDFSLKLPANLKLKRLHEKYILHKAFDSRLPPQIARKSKQAFAAPYLKWLPSLCEQYLKDSHAAKNGLFSQGQLDKLVARDRLYRGRLDEKLWTLIIFEIWYRVFIDESLSDEIPRLRQQMAKYHA